MLVPELFNDSMFDDFFQDMGFPFYNDHDMRMAEKKLYGRRGKNLMKTDIKENEQGYELEMDLPGFKKEEVQVYVSFAANRQNVSIIYYLVTALEN